MQYKNPVIVSDYSDPDVIRVGDDFYMVASSFNHVPGVPVLHSKNLVEWEIINYVIDSLPFEKFNKVRHGEGAWAPSLREHNGKFYCLIPFPDEGIYVAETEDLHGKWSLLRPLITGAGYEDPCPIWHNGKCYIVFAFVKSRIGFNSKLAVVEADEELKSVTSEYKIIFDGHDIAPNIEGPKFYKKGIYFYILAPVGGVRTGWQVALRSQNIYGPYEHKVILRQGDSPVNGPHQGALIDLDDYGEKWAFMHFQDMGAYGRVVHLQPAVWENGWVICGKYEGDNIAGTPVPFGEYPVNVSTGYAIDPSDEFDGDKLSLVWQTPANRGEDWYSLKRGLKLNCIYYEGNSLSDVPQLFMQKVNYFNFSIKCKCKLNLINDGDEAGFVMFGRKYVYACVVRRDGANYMEIREGVIGGESDETLAKSQLYDDDYVTFSLSAKRENPYNLTFKLSFGGSAFTHKFSAERGVWTGAKVGVYARSNEENSKGSALFKHFRVTCTDNRVNPEN
ncbi:MAG: glycoside hydrolase 43 family protein [Clostridia bacterium]|nr:glycoside hydrolase 43 family protein [Clostridia bacterium]